MIQKQNIKSLPKFFDRLYIPGLLLILVILFTTLLPKTSSTLFFWKRQLILHDFLTSAQKNKQIDSQTYWHFREFYSPGSYTFNRDGINNNITSGIEKNAQMLYQNLPKPMLLFQSPLIKSVEFLVNSPTLSDYLRLPNNTHILLSTSNQIMYLKNNMYIIALDLPITQMQKANGFFDYKGQDKTLLVGKYWLTISIVNN